MSPRCSPILLVLILVMAFSPSVLALDEEVRSEPPGLLLMEIDGLSEPLLRAAIEDGTMPFVGGLVDMGSHTLGRWQTTTTTTTTAAHAGLLHGDWRDIVGFRWWDRDLGQLVDSGDPEDARAIEDAISGPADLLADDGSSVTNMFSGGAPRIVFTGSHLAGSSLVWDALRAVADPRSVYFVLDGFFDGLRADARRLAGGDAPPVTRQGVKRKAPVPIVGPGLEWALIDVTAAAVISEMQQGAPTVYASFSTYDEVGHYAGSEHPAAIGALEHIDTALSAVAAAAEGTPRPYRLVVLSDHGQTDGDSFERRYGETLTEVVRALLTEPPERDTDSALPDLVVASSGNLAHIYFPEQGRRSTAEELDALHPELVTRLAAHPGIGIIVAVTEEGGLLAQGPSGSHELTTGAIVGQDPVGHYGAHAVESLVNIAAPRNAGDLVVISVYDRVAEEVASFERQLGSHGGIGGPQMLPFLLYPTELEPDHDALALTGIDEVRAKILEWSEISP